MEYVIFLISVTFTIEVFIEYRKAYIKYIGIILKYHVGNKYNIRPEDVFKNLDKKYILLPSDFAKTDAEIERVVNKMIWEKQNESR